MKTENLEALLLDRALGDMSPASMELLDEYLVQNPAAVAKLDELSITLRAAREAMLTPMLGALPAFPRELLEKEKCGGRWRRQTVQVLKLAACFVIGISLGWFGKAPRNTETMVRVTTAPLVSPDPKLGRTVSPSAGFWSVARFETQQSAKKSEDKASRHRLHLESPVKIPKVEEKL